MYFSGQEFIYEGCGFDVMKDDKGSAGSAQIQGIINENVSLFLSGESESCLVFNFC